MVAMEHSAGYMYGCNLHTSNNMYIVCVDIFIWEDLVLFYNYCGKAFRDRFFFCEWLTLSLSLSLSLSSSTESVLQYDVDLQETDHLSFHGPAILELRDGELIVYRKDSRSEIVRWRLSHIRSFKAKKRLLTIYSGRYVRMWVKILILCIRVCMYLRTITFFFVRLCYCCRTVYEGKEWVPLCERERERDCLARDRTLSKFDQTIYTISIFGPQYTNINLSYSSVSIHAYRRYC